MQLGNVLLRTGLWTSSFPKEVNSQTFAASTADCLSIVTAFSILTDFILAALPVVIVWNVQISTRTKVSLCLLMGLGVM